MPRTRASAGSDAAWGDGALHPTIAALIERARAAGIPPIGAGSPAQARATMALARPGLGEGPPMRDLRTVAVPTRGGAIPALLCVPNGPIAGLCVFLHGGGWVIGTPADYETLGRALAARSACAVLLPDYRLAPEHPFPAGLDDAEDALRWAWSERAALAGGDVPLVLAGDSAGGNLAACASARLRGALPLAGQALIYPVADADFERPSYHAFGIGLPLRREDMLWFFRHYAPEASWGDPAISPLHDPDLGGQPPTIVQLAELDVLRDEGEALARQLDQAGRLVALHRYPAVNHGFLRMHNLVDTADRALDDLAAALAAFCRSAG